ncbi:hypothetical protein [Amycolatopsis pigmentata]|uniref:Uncharacterized protein n=1 Tax=Amycolatopsis pigmentata TaxID=450801 RepID=A0ABW5G742_9PSEU
MTPDLRKAGRIGGMALSVSLIAIIVLIALGMTAPKGTDPFFYLALGLCGAGAVALLLAGIGALFARDRTPTLPAMDREFFAGVRRMVLAMWLCAVVTDALGILLLLAIKGGTGGAPPLGRVTLGVAYTVAAVTVICAGVSSIAMRRLLPRV